MRRTLLAEVREQGNATQDPLGRGLFGSDLGTEDEVGLRCCHSTLAGIFALVHWALIHKVLDLLVCPLHGGDMHAGKRHVKHLCWSFHKLALFLRLGRILWY